MNCPKCQSVQIIKYGHTHYGKPCFRCQSCRRQFVEHATRQPIDEATPQLIDKLLLERLALVAIARVTGVSERWLQMYVNQKFYQTPKTVDVSPKTRSVDNSTRRDVVICGLQTKQTMDLVSH